MKYDNFFETSFEFGVNKKNIHFWEVEFSTAIKFTENQQVFT